MEPLSAAARAIAFRHATHAAVCDRIEPWEHGTAVFASAHPTFWAYNCARVEDADAALTARDLVAALDRLQAGLGHRRAEVEDAATGARLRPGLAAMGWTTERLVWMELEGPVVGGLPARAEVAEVPFADTRPLRREWYADEEWGGDAEGRQRFLAGEEEVGTQRGMRAFAAFGPAGETIGYVAFAAAGDAVEVEQAYVVPRHRGAGIGAALVTAAVAAAGVPRAWIVADDEGTPKRLYARLGFRPVWVQHVFTRPHSVRRPPA